MFHLKERKSQIIRGETISFFCWFDCDLIKVHNALLVCAIFISKKYAKILCECLFSV